jgi:hypothetical protein
VYFRLREAEAAGAELRPRTALVTA